MTNFCYASLIEVSKVSRFINDFLSDLKVHLDDPTDTLNLNQWEITPRLYQTSQQASSLVEHPLNIFIMQDFMLMIEAMTSPTANKPIDYERLEFYGDSVISFLVILELFLATANKERMQNEGELDF